MYNKEIKDRHLFSNLGYSGIISDKLEIKWSDAPVLFRKLVTVKSTAAKKANAVKADIFFEQKFTHNKVKYLATFYPVTYSDFLCIIYPEEYFLKFAYSDLYSMISGIKADAIGIAADIDIMREILTQEGLLEKYRDTVDEYMTHAGSIITSTDSIIRMFDISHICEYVMISEKLDGTIRQLERYNNQLDKKVGFDVDIKKSVARINYTVFESAIMDLGKVLWSVLAPGEEAYLKITEKKDGSLSVSTSAPYSKDHDFPSIEHDIRIINCLFECLCGDSKFYKNDDKFIFKATVPAYLSNYVNRIKVRDEIFAESEDYGREITGFHSFISQRNGKIQFHSHKEKYQADISTILADVILGDLINFDYSERI